MLAASPTSKSSAKSVYFAGDAKAATVSPNAIGVAARGATAGKPDTQSLAVPSCDPVAICVASGENATDVTPAVWPVSPILAACSPSNVVTDVPPAVCHNTAVLSSEPVKNQRASGEKATLRTA